MSSSDAREDKFWNALGGNWVYINNYILQYLGCTFNKYIELLRDNFDEKREYKIFSDTSFKKIVDIFIIHSNTTAIPRPVTSADVIESDSDIYARHMIVEPNAFKHSCLMIGSTRGKAIRQYFMNKRELAKIYITTYLSEQHMASPA